MTESAATLVTGATGFVGSHLVAELLRRDRQGTIVCVARGGAGATARDRVIEAVAGAFRVHDGLPDDPDWPSRIVVIEASLKTIAERLSAARSSLPSAVPGLWHCASSTVYENTDEIDLHEANVEGTRNVLAACKALGCRAINYVGTAYVAGRRDGVIAERLPGRDDEYNNAYEFTKAQAERLVAESSARNGLSWRIFRPSIVIGHSRTFGSNSGGSFNGVIDAAFKTRRMVLQRDPDYFSRKAAFSVHLDEGALLNLIPIDHVIDDMLAIDASGGRAAGKVFHITSHNQIRVADAMRAFSEVFGIEIVCDRRTKELDRVERAFDRAIGLFSAYLGSTKLFERTNEALCGIEPAHASWQPSTDMLKQFIRVRHSETAI